MGTAPVFASVGEAMDTVRAGLAFVAAADMAGLTAASRRTSCAGWNGQLGRAAARTSALGAFTAGQGYRPMRTTARGRG